MRRMLMVSTISRFLRDFLLPYAEHFRAQGWQVDALTNGTSIYPECQAAFDHLWEIHWSRNPLDPRNFMQAPAVIKQLVEREKYDLVHVHTPVAAFVTRYALRQRQKNGGPKVIYTAHGFHFHPEGDPVKNALFLGLEKLAGRWTDYLIVINAEDEAAARQYGIVPTNKILYMPGIGIDLQRYDPQRVAPADVVRVRQELGLSAADTLFLMIAEFNPGKHHRIALEAFAKLQLPNTHLAFAGEGPMLDETRQLASEYSILDRIHFLGFRSDIATLIRASTATLLPSEREGLPRAILESFSLEVPAIGTDIRGIHDLISAKTGILVKIGDVHGIANAMEWLVKHPEERQAMGKYGRKQMLNYNLQRIIDMHEQLYDRAVADIGVFERFPNAVETLE